MIQVGASLLLGISAGIGGAWAQRRKRAVAALGRLRRR